MAKYLKMTITANALVKKGAIGEKAIFKSKDMEFSLIDIKKNDVKYEMHSIWYMVNKDDAHGDSAANEKVVEDACLDFMLNGSKTIKLTHSGGEVDAYVMQLYIVPAGHPIWKDAKYTGALAGVIKFTDQELYEICKNEQWETSIEGQAMTEDIVKDEDGFIKKIVKAIKEALSPEPINKVDIVLPEMPAKPAEPEAPKEIAPEIKAYISAELEAFKMKIMEELKGESMTAIEDAKKKVECSIEAIKKAHEAEIVTLKKEIGKSSQVEDTGPETKKINKTIFG